MKKAITILSALITAIICAYAHTVTDEGAWCWFADPRALHHATADSTIDMTYVGYIDTHGNIRAMQYDFINGTQREVLVRSYFQPDDHDNPTFLALPDTRVMVFYSRHTDEPCFYYRITEPGGDLTTLGKEHVIATAHNTTYPSPFILDSDPDHFYLCWRGINWHPTIARITLPDDNGEVKVDWGPYQIVQSTGARPYAKYHSDGRNHIGIAYTTGHPDNESPNHLYYNYIDITDMTLHDVEGNVLSHISDGPHAVNKSEAYVAQHPTAVVDASGYRDWVWQLAFDPMNRPVIAMTRISDDKKSHNYYISQWDGQSWQHHMVAHGGGHFHQSADIEHCYSAGMAINPAHTNEVYCSVPVVGANGKTYEIIKYVLDANGEIRSCEAITSNSSANCIRPYFMASSANTPLHLLWMRGDYYDWIVSRERPGYPTAIECDFDGFSAVEPIQVQYEVIWDYAIEKPLKITIDGYTFTYWVDPNTLYPEIVYKRHKYKGSNKLATAEGWRSAPRATDGRWHDAVPLQRPTVQFEIRNGKLHTLINGLYDQCIDL